MKTNYILQTLVLLFLVSTASAQQGINYKAIINDVDGNDSFTVRASDGNEAAHRALETLGWWVAKPF